MPFALYRNNVKISEPFPTEAALWTDVREAGLARTITEDEDTAPRTVLNPDLKIHVMADGKKTSRGSK